ncbi:hypothetical protein [Marinomonas aquiplantarum]|nr:hypothetical protein [Marinomonas aquiplantarum]
MRILSPSCPLVVYALLVCLLSGCGKTLNLVEKTAGKYVPFYSYDKTLLTSIKLQAEANSNNNLPTALDIVFIFDAKSISALMDLSGPDWFSNKASLALLYQQKISVLSYEVVPQTAPMTLTLPAQYYQAYGVLLFANYLDEPGQYLADISQFKQLLITLQQHGYQLEEQAL